MQNYHTNNLGKKLSVPIASKKAQIIIGNNLFERFDIERPKRLISDFNLYHSEIGNFLAVFGSINRHLPSHIAPINLVTKNNLDFDQFWSIERINLWKHRANSEWFSYMTNSPANKLLAMWKCVNVWRRTLPKPRSQKYLANMADHSGVWKPQFGSKNGKLPGQTAGVDQICGYRMDRKPVTSNFKSC